jgi:hypothetical protein
MTHLTEGQILAYADGSADYLTMATCTNHLAGCEQCRREVELQKSILRTARSTGLLMPSRSFTRRVMSRIVPSRTRLAMRWILNNMGAMFAMMAVGGVTGAVVLGERSDGGTTLKLPDMDISGGVGALNGLWEQASGMMARGLALVKLPAITGEGNLVLIVTSVLALILLDRLMKRKFVTTSHR